MEMHGKEKGYLLLKNLMDNMTDMIYFKDLQSRFIMMNKSAALWQGFQHPDDAVGCSDFDRYRKEDAQRMLVDEQRIIQTGEPMDGVEEQETRIGGQQMWVSTTKMPLKNKAGEIIGTFGISRDITEHKEAELQAARYAEEIRTIKEGMEEDIRMAAELQKTFFPRTYPTFPAGVSEEHSAVRFYHYYQPSGTVSGDFCGIHRLSRTKFSILQCDVMGHGIRAALGTALICSIVEELVQQEHDPGIFLRRMNELLLPILRQEDMFLYATACYMVYDAETGRLQLANAGHPVPLMFKTEEGTATWLMDDAATRGPALAIDAGAEFPTQEIQVKPGDAVVMYTDGLYEVLNAADEELGEQRFLDVAQRHVGLSLKKMFPALISDALQFAKEEDFDDDICLVGFECRALVLSH